MSQNLKKVLHNKGLEITFVVDEGVARVDYRADGELAAADDIVLFVNGDSISVELLTPNTARGVIGDWSALSGSTVSLMTRVDEFFDGWEFDP